MNENKKIYINNFYSARITEKYRPLFAKNAEFIKLSKYYLYFEKIEDRYKEIFTGEVIDNVINDLTKAQLGMTSIINPKLVNVKKLNKVQLEQGYITIYDVIKIFKNQKAMRREKEKGRAKVKKIGAIV